MTGIADWTLALVMIAVLAILGLGVLNMARGGSPQRSQRLMRWRVGLQAFALLLVVAILWLGR
ncbi:MAG: twin transmembrane helix small protein [Siculibacillus sp.]|nr:twin transmembrane helix small protein [Siculibacillus sp.]